MPSRVDIGREEARRSKRSIQTVMGMNELICHCAKCKGRKSYPQATVDKHMALYPPSNLNGESAPQASTSDNKSEPIPMDLDQVISRAPSPTLSDHFMTPVDSPATNDVQHIAGLATGALIQDLHIHIYKSRAADAPAKPFELRRAPSRSPSPILAHSREACTFRPPSPECMIDESLLDNWLGDPPQFRPTSPVPSDYDPYGTPLPATPLGNTPEPEQMAQEIDLNENGAFFANLYDDVLSNADDNEEYEFESANKNFDGREDPGENQLEDEEGAEGYRQDEQDIDENMDRPAPDDNDEPPIQVDDDDDEDHPNEEEPAAAFQEHPLLRNIYLRVYIDLAFHHATKEQVRTTLLSHKLALEAAAQLGELPQGLLEGLLKMPLTVRSLERRLGMDMTRKIRIYTLCEGCGTRYSAEEIKTALHPGCMHIQGDNQECNTTLYNEETLSDGTRKRNPIRSYVYIPILWSLEQLLCRPGMKELLQLWRGNNPDNRARDVPPRSHQYWEDHAPEKIGDISEAKEWWSIPVGLVRSEVDGGYGDWLPEHLVALAGKILGLIFAVNADGYQAFSNGKYSTMGVYLTIENLPFYLRTLIENMLLVCVIPGPNEPTAYEFNQIMNPFIDDLIALSQGVRLNIFNRAEGRLQSELVYGHLSLGIFDHIARLMVCGHAGTRSERNFCLYCKKRRCYLSVAEGFKLRENELRDPVDRLDDKYRWLNAPTAAAQERLRQQTGVTFTEFDRLPGWYAASNCPVDVMHLFDLGITKYICQNVLLKPGLLHPLRFNQPFDEQPASKFDAFVARTQFPSFCQRKPPRFLNMTSGIKAEQWRHIAIILPAALFEAWRDGDEMPNTFIPRGGRNTKVYKFQEAQAKEMLRNRRLVHWDRGGRRRDNPNPLSCVAVRNRRLLYATICYYLLARSTMVRYKFTQNAIAVGQRLLQRFGRNLANMNYPATPNVHTALHLREGMLQYGSVYGFHTAPFERANRVLINVNNNGRTGGGVEATMARGWLKRAGCHALVREMQGIVNPSPDDTATTEMILRTMRNGPEHERQRGRLDAILAGEDVFQSQATVRLATTSAEVDWYKGEHRPYWELVADHCSQRLPGIHVYPYGQRPEGGVRLTSKNSTRSLPHVHANGIRYGTDFHRWAYNSRYAYIDPQKQPVLIKRLYKATLPVGNVDQEVVCAVIQRFQPPINQPGFPWDRWGNHLEIASWIFEELDEPEVIDISRFSGAFALSDIQMSTGHYWLTFAMQPTGTDMVDGAEQ